MVRWCLATAMLASCLPGTAALADAPTLRPTLAASMTETARPVTRRNRYPHHRHGGFSGAMSARGTARNLGFSASPGH